jgi:hypothetical protein
MRSWSRGSLAWLVALTLLGIHHGARADKPVVAVFGIEDKTGVLDKATLQQLTEYLTNQVAEGGVFLVVPSSRLRERLVQQKVESYKECYDEQCQIEIGRELAAKKSLATQVVKVGSLCAIMATLFDLKRATTQAAASTKGGCLKDDLVASLERAIDSIKQQVTSKKGPTVGSLLLKSTPEGAEVRIDGTKAKGTTPLLLHNLPAGEHVVLLAKGDYRRTEKLKVIAGRVSEVSLYLNLVPEAEERQESERDRQRADQERALLQVKAERRRQSIWAYSTLSAGVALAACAGVLYGLGASQGSEAHDKYREATFKLPPGDKDEIAGYRSDIESARNKIIAGNVLAGTAVAVLAYSVYRFVTRRPPPEEPARRTVALDLVPAIDARTVSLVGRF